MPQITIILNDARSGEDIREITIDPTTCYAHAGQTVTWTLTGKKIGFFTLLFPKHTPFDDVEVHSSGVSAAKDVPNPTPPKRYHYYVAVRGDDAAGAPDVYLIAGCPEIIIR